MYLSHDSCVCLAVLSSRAKAFTSHSEYLATIIKGASQMNTRQGIVRGEKGKCIQRNIFVKAFQELKMA